MPHARDITKPSYVALRAGLSALHHTGLSALFKNRLQGWGSVLCLHHVCPAEENNTGFAPNSKLEITPQFLNDLIIKLRRDGFETVSLATAVASLKSGIKPEKPFAVFTLDDGYRDNLIYAKPVFDRLNCPYTIFVTPGFVDGTAAIWWRTLEKMVACHDHLRIVDDGKVFDLKSQTTLQKSNAFDQLFDYVEHLLQDRQRATVRKFASQFDHDWAGEASSAVMNWAELRAISQSPLCTLGAHTNNHLALRHLPGVHSFAEMLQSKQRLEHEIGLPVAYFAYPYGDAVAAGPREFELAAKIGFDASLTTRKGVLFPAHAHHLQALPRIMVSGRFQTLRHVETLMNGLPTAMINRGRKVNVG